MANNVNKVANTNKDKGAKTVILVLTLVLSIAFIMLAFLLPSRPGSSDSGNKHTISGRLYTGSNSVSVSGSQHVYYSFVPSTSGTYRFYSNNASSSLDPAAVLYSSSWSRLTSNDDSSSSTTDFSISRTLTSGETYYLEVYLANSSSSSSSSSRTVSVYVQRTSS